RLVALSSILSFQIGCLSVKAQETFFDLGTIQKLEIFFSQPDWNHQLHVLKITTEGYLKADSIRVNGVTFPNIGVKYKGNSSYDSTWVKNPLHLALDKYQNQNYQGVTEMKLSNCYQDPSMIREVLSYAILGKYMEAPRANFAKVYVNGMQFGLYSNIEDVSKGFCAKKFKSTKSNTFIKGNPIVTPGPAVKSNLKYLGADSSDYFNFYEMKSSNGWNQLVSLCDAASNNPSGLPQLLDMDRFIWMLAFDNVLVNLDSYMGAFAQNYYLFKDNNGFFNPIVWDLNMSFGGFPFAGSSNTSLGTLSIANMKQFPISIHQTDPFWPVINVIHGNPRWKKMYQAHIRTLVKEQFESGIYDTIAGQLRAVIDTAVATDPNKFFSYEFFQNGLTTDYSVGNYLVPGIRNLMAARTTYLLARPEIAAVPPTISTISAQLNNLTGIATVTAFLSNHEDTAVFLGFRENATKKFQRIRMWDDGLHGDGPAGDQVYGAGFQADAVQSQFYVYAENTSAASFSPERAEFEFHNLTSFTSIQPDIFSNKSEVSVFPNPAMDRIFVKLPQPSEVEILDGLGRVIWKGNADESQAISTSGWIPGIYIVKSGFGSVKLILNR
ncbi:MAG TPA: CotH kinase family protein, partial [Catalimonadaceae bacterium]|nr:CotH kinase family protein [Catalimonadaceae bacterium]